MRGVKLVVKLFFVKLFFSSLIEDFQNFLTNFYDVRISVAQATQLRLLNVWTIRQLQCIHLAFEPKQKIKSNRSSLFPVGRRSPCATVTVINRQFDALFEIKIFLYLRLKFFQMLQCSMVKRIDRLSFDYCIGSNLPCGYRVMHARGGLESASVRVAIYNQIRP